jgi:RING/Ubox like zinc-binding domain
MEDLSCPLCTESLDETDLLGQFCSCNFKICLFCQKRLIEEAGVKGVPPTCPNCRGVYDQDRIQKQQHDPNLYVPRQQACVLYPYLFLPSRSIMFERVETELQWLSLCGGHLNKSCCFACPREEKPPSTHLSWHILLCLLSGRHFGALG